MASDLRIAPDDIAGLGLFQALPPMALSDVAALARVRRFPAETQIFSQGDDGVRAHAVIAGGVRISQAGSDGGRIVVRFIAPGEMFGTVALFTDGLYPADAVTIAETLEASWSENDLLDLMGRYPRIAINMIRIIGKRLQEVQERLREASTQRAAQRVARAVLRLARQAGHDTLDGTAIKFPLRRRDVADISGTTLYTASRILTGWEKAGLLASHNRHLTIHQPSGILRIAEDAVD
jgi:CRP/FNR family transcriptional regulator, nitrogen oxide reductase regulator